MHEFRKIPKNSEKFQKIPKNPNIPNSILEITQPCPNIQCLQDLAKMHINGDNEMCMES